jgi:hypothetical protein
MFVAPKNANIEMWEGARTGIEAAKEIFGADEVCLQWVINNPMWDSKHIHRSPWHLE